MKNERKSASVARKREKRRDVDSKPAIGLKSLFCCLLLVICYLFLASACGQPDEMGSAYQGKMGTFTLKIAGHGRTILPSISENDFEWYRLTFANAETSEEQSFDCRRGSLRVTLEAAVYSLEVAAYTDAGCMQEEKPQAIGRLASVSILAGIEVSAAITLTALGMEEGEGIFSWDIGLPSGLEEAVMLITRYGSPDTEPITLFFAGGQEDAANPGELELESGCYSVVLKLTKDNKTKPVIWPEELHIYQNMESCFKYDFTGVEFVLLPSTDGDVIIDISFEQIADDNTILPWDGFSEPLVISLLSGNGYTLTLSDFNLYDTVSWYIDGEYLTGTQSFTLAAQNFTIVDAGTHSLTVKVKIDGKFYNRTVEFLVTQTIDFRGNGTPENPFLIATSNGLRELAEKVNNGAVYNNGGEESSYRYAHYRLTAAIDLGGENGGNWIPIGTEPAAKRFLGVFDGGGFTITGLHITTGEANQGLFGSIGDRSKVCNLGVGGTVSGGNYSGGIVGNNFGTVENCYSAVTVTGGNYTGGVVGGNRTNGKIRNCYSTGSVLGTGNTGGITGNNTGSSQVQNCVSLGLAVDGGENTGRIIGNSSGTLKDNKARADMLVNGSEITGGTTDNIHGADIEIGTPLALIFSGWDSDIWHIPDVDFTDGGELPLFR